MVPVTFIYNWGFTLAPQAQLIVAQLLTRTCLAEMLVLSPPFGLTICSMTEVSQGTRFPLLSVPAVDSFSVLQIPLTCLSLPHTNADPLALKPCVVWF